MFIKTHNMAKKTIRLTENDLHNIIKESVNTLLTEDRFDSMDNIFLKIGKDDSNYDPVDVYNFMDALSPLISRGTEMVNFIMNYYQQCFNGNGTIEERTCLNNLKFLLNNFNRLNTALKKYERDIFEVRRCCLRRHN
jgi:hypothetical protein